ncbi:hypothetical protein BUALT_Bualt03G0159600 [Buddleja alternifolia]|uniref:X8 domain-containing protein n=1 Tax=Buddleja alternifolia TaxID=168488 RepID=A0AAV6XU52_9LAMI|nr:hypothetical protein BUALT_Bualt03G0159600 [Buddleja alternifolia]
MEENGVPRLRFCILSLYVCFAAICLVHCDATVPIHRFRARKHFRNSITKTPRKMHALRNIIDIDMPLDSSNTDPYVSSPFSLPPYESLPPFGLPENAPPYCLNPPSTPLPPSTNPSPIVGYTPSPPPASTGPTFPGPSPLIPNPPTTDPTPPTEPGLSPPYFEPSPPYYEPSPPSGYLPGPPSGYQPGPSGPPFNIPSPSGSIPSPTFLPPIVYPPPTVPPPPHRTPATTMWCVAKASVPEPIIQEAMNYACGSGADCDQIQSSGSCFQPNTIIAHASYAFNSYWQKTKVAGGTCDFGGTAILVTVDPSYDGCRFIYF